VPQGRRESVGQASEARDCGFRGYHRACDIRFHGYQFENRVSE